ncbi:MAG: PspC domain-containing protein, partial [Bacteroidota bacterium]
DGVCGGVAEYFGLDSTLVRIAWVLLTLFGGSGIILYILAMIIMPPNPSVANSAPGRIGSMNNQKFWGVLLVVVGGMWLLSNLGLSLWHHWWDLSWDVVLAVVLILAGVAFLFGGRNYVSAAPPPEVAGNDSQSAAEPVAQVAPRKLYRSRAERKLTGVCGGLGTYFGIDPTIVRLLFVVAAIASFGFAVLAYIIMSFVVQEEPPIVVVS